MRGRTGSREARRSKGFPPGSGVDLCEVAPSPVSHLQPHLFQCLEIAASCKITLLRCCGSRGCRFLPNCRLPPENSKAFIETRVLWLLRAAVLRSKAAFSGFVQMLADLHGTPADRENDCYRFEHHWLLLEVLTVLWARSPSVVRTTWWPLDTKHASWLR